MPRKQRCGRSGGRISVCARRLYPPFVAAVLGYSARKTSAEPGSIILLRQRNLGTPGLDSATRATAIHKVAATGRAMPRPVSRKSPQDKKPSSGDGAVILSCVWRAHRATRSRRTPGISASPRPPIPFCPRTIATDRRDATRGMLGPWQRIAPSLPPHTGVARTRCQRPRIPPRDPSQGLSSRCARQATRKKERRSESSDRRPKTAVLQSQYRWPPCGARGSNPVTSPLEGA